MFVKLYCLFSFFFLPVTTTPPPGSGHARRCNDTEKAYCVNGGDCYFIHGINRIACKCGDGYFGRRCSQTEPLRSYMPDPFKSVQMTLLVIAVKPTLWPVSTVCQLLSSVSVSDCPCVMHARWV
ncbi:hypothetical protein ILYODFUR_011670 [Ilyodon furcidens]|uniref:EGF-like domain-containing protein n=1 Tax=Ilyodon furcidens TaxID=33524 RepID=A0ABV0UJD1_9TELE